MKRILLDTSVYGKLIEEDGVRRLVETRLKLNEYVVYGSQTIRKELRDTPRGKVVRNSQLRLLLLEVYDSFVRKQNHDLKLNPLVERLSGDYFKEYKKQRGSFSQHEMKNDFMIIATATIYNLDVVVSNDDKTMLSHICINVYKSVNKKYGLTNPILKHYQLFKKELMS